MAFPFGGTNCKIQKGSPLEDIQTGGIGFLALSGESKVKLLPTPWPNDKLPPPTASLLSIASKKGLIAAAGPELIILATTLSLRKAFEDTESKESNSICFEPQLKISMKFRISQLAFSSDENYLVLSAEDGGGLAVYDVSSLLNGSQQTIFELSTNGQPLRALVPNPIPEKEEYLAVITMNGNLMMANLKERKFVSGPQGVVLRDQVSCISWSTKGKQLVAGLGDGTAHQMTPEGEGKSEIPRPPDISLGHYISSISWLENHMFLLIHTPYEFDNNEAPLSSLHIVTRTADCQEYTFQKISDPAPPFGLNRSPPHQSILRLRNFPPNIQDILILASTASTDIGLLTRSKVPLTNDKPPEKITGVFTMTEMFDDSRRAQLPLSTQSRETSPIGFSLDLSSNSNVVAPIPGDEISESSTPLPAVMVLNNEGILASWWIVYSESVRNRTIYPGLTAAAEINPSNNTMMTTSSSSPRCSSIMEQKFGTAAFGLPNATAFETNTLTSTFGAKSGLASFSTFGAPSNLGNKVSPWATSSPQNAFPTTKAAFEDTTSGSNMQMPSFSSAFKVPVFGQASKPTFSMYSSAWLSTGNNNSSTASEEKKHVEKSTSSIGSFANYASKNAFMVAENLGTKESVLSIKNSSNAFSASNEGKDQVIQSTSMAPFGVSGVGEFKLHSTFKSDGRDEALSDDTKLSKSSENWCDAFVRDLKKVSTSPTCSGTGVSIENQNIPFSDPTPKVVPQTPKRNPPYSNSLNSSTLSGTCVSNISPEPRIMSSYTTFGQSSNDKRISDSNCTSQKHTLINIEQEPEKDLIKNVPIPEAPLPPDPINFANPDINSIQTSLPLLPDDESMKNHGRTNLAQNIISGSSEVDTSGAKDSAADFSGNSRDPKGHSSILKLENDRTLSPVSLKEKDQKQSANQNFFPSNMVESKIDKNELPTPTPLTCDLAPEREIQKSDLPSEEQDRDDDYDDENDDSQVTVDKYSRKKIHEAATKTSSFSSDVNHVSGLSPESSYDFVENDLIENSSVTKTPKSLHDIQSRKPVNEKELVTELDEKSPPSPTPVRNHIIDKSSSSEYLRSLDTPGVATEIPDLKHSSERSDAQSKVLKSNSFQSDQKIGKNFNEGYLSQIGAKENQDIEYSSLNAQIKIDVKNLDNFESQIISEKRQQNKIQAEREAEEKRHNELVARTEAEEKRRNDIIAERKAEEKRHNELVAQRQAEERRHKEIIAQRKAEEKRRNELVAQWEAEQKCREELKAKKEAEEKQALVDEDDEHMQIFLASEIDRTTKLNDFVAHSDYVSMTSVDNIPAQVETVFRDINSMIDTLGLNARSLKEFVLGHTEECKQERRTRDDLNDDSNWVLGEIGILSSIVENDLKRELEIGRVKDIDKKLEACKNLQKDASKIRAKHSDIKKIIATSQDSEYLAMARAQPLGPKQASQQRDLRHGFIKFQRLLSEAEEGVAIFKAKMVAQTASNKKPGSSNGLTVEAVMRTINKLTSMIEKKSGDIDVLEGHIRRLKLNSSAVSSIGNQEVLTTPIKYRSPHRNPTSNTYGLFTPERVKYSPFQNSLISSVGSFNQGSPPRKKMSGYTSEEKIELRYKLDRKKAVVDKLRTALQNSGVMIRSIDIGE